MRKVWYAEEKGGEVRYYHIPLFFLKEEKSLKLISLSKLRTWARFLLWLKEAFEIKVW